MLPFGLRSAPCIFNYVASMVEWILIHNYDIRDLLHYLDDCILAGSAGSSISVHVLNFEKAISIVSQQGLPLHPQKCIGPASCLDTVAEVACLPVDKLTALRQLLQLWSWGPMQLERLGTFMDMVQWPVAPSTGGIIDCIQSVLPCVDCSSSVVFTMWSQASPV